MVQALDDEGVRTCVVQWAVGCGLWAVGCGLWAVGCGLWAVGCGLWAVGMKRVVYMIAWGVLAKSCRGMEVERVQVCVAVCHLSTSPWKPWPLLHVLPVHSGHRGPHPLW